MKAIRERAPGGLDGLTLVGFPDPGAPRPGIAGAFGWQEGGRRFGTVRLEV